MPKLSDAQAICSPPLARAARNLAAWLVARRRRRDGDCRAALSRVSREQPSQSIAMPMRA